METKTYTTFDRTGWPAGEWDGEPDKVQWQDEATGLPCLAVRSRLKGNWCGYVGVAEGHRDFGRDFGDLDYEVHGGLTFADTCQPGADESQGICHVPAEGEPDHVYWLGFDCGHAWDAAPQDYKDERDRPEWFYRVNSEQTYRTLAYVQNQCRRLAAQLAAAPEPEA
jgi:hypothetical protein